ncbi:elongator complex protein 5-like isoform X2 [Apostichopus japonicus]|uniref:elongator complex protein 5-like isoform X2 n=1 Tax=Stichopus japonicus TaxID=307972 RepID=UPI003AB887C4
MQLEWALSRACERLQYDVPSSSDSLNHSGKQLLFALANHVLDRVDEIHVIISEVEPDEVKKFFEPEAFSKVVVHDYWTNPLGWNVSEDDTLRVNSDEDLFSGVWSTPRASSSSKIAVVVDVISSFLPYQTDSVISTSIWSLLHATKGIPEIQSVCVLGLIHADLHTEKTLNALRHLANIQIRLLPIRPTSSASDEAGGNFEITVNKKSGKVKRQKESYTVNDRSIVCSVLQVGQQALTPFEEVQPDPTANLTFNLTLKDSERKAKENVVLPYTSRQDKSSDGGQSQIFYEPDEADDFDEEDPDDDLDI